MATIASGLRICAGIVSFFMIKTSARANETMEKVTMEPVSIKFSHLAGS